MDNYIKDKYKQYESDDSIKDNITVVIPVLNEEEAIGKVIRNVKKEGYDNILVVDGYSTDKTVHVASKNGVNIIYQRGIGKTGAIKTAIEHVTTPYLVFLDGDCTYDSKDIKSFFPHLHEYDEIIGARTFGRENIPIINRFGNWIITLFFNLLFDTNLVDVCSGMYALNAEIAKKLDLGTKGFDVEAEIAAKVAIMGKIIQVPIRYHKRVGERKLRAIPAGISILSTIWKVAKQIKTPFQRVLLTSLTIIPALIILLWILLNL